MPETRKRQTGNKAASQGFILHGKQADTTKGAVGLTAINPQFRFKKYPLSGPSWGRRIVLPVRAGTWEWGNCAPYSGNAGNQYR
ncbi:hypothetical protein D9M69_650360 [compost metagenome]